MRTTSGEASTDYKVAVGVGLLFLGGLSFYVAGNIMEARIEREGIANDVVDIAQDFNISPLL